MNYPKTLEEAKKFRYNKWAGNPKGDKYNENRCACKIFPLNNFHSSQCSRKNGYGPEKLYCKQHAKKINQNEFN